MGDGRYERIIAFREGEGYRVFAYTDYPIKFCEFTCEGVEFLIAEGTIEDERDKKRKDS